MFVGNRKRFYKLFCICSGQILQACTYQNRHFVEFCVITMPVTVSSGQNARQSKSRSREFLYWKSKIIFPIALHFWRNIRYSQSWWKSLFKFHVRFTRRIWITLYGLQVLTSIFILLQMFLNFLMLLSTGNITLCENIIEASEMTEKVSIRLFLFLMKVTVQVPCSFHSLRMLQNVLRVDVSRQDNFSGPRKRLLHKIL